MNSKCQLVVFELLYCLFVWLLPKGPRAWHCVTMVRWRESRVAFRVKKNEATLMMCYFVLLVEEKNWWSCFVHGVLNTKVWKQDIVCAPWASNIACCVTWSERSWSKEAKNQLVHAGSCSKTNMKNVQIWSKSGRLISFVSEEHLRGIVMCMRRMWNACWHLLMVSLFALVCIALSRTVYGQRRQR